MQFLVVFLLLGRSGFDGTSSLCSALAVARDCLPGSFCLKCRSGGGRKGQPCERSGTTQPVRIGSCERIHLPERDLNVGFVWWRQSGRNHLRDDGAQLDTDNLRQGDGGNASDGHADSLSGRNRHNEWSLLSSFDFRRRTQRSSQCGFWTLHVGSVVGDDYVHSLLFVSIPIDDRFGLVRHTGNAERGMRGRSDFMEKFPVQRHHPGERPRLSHTLYQHVQCSWNDLSALEPVGVERLWSFPGLHRTWSLPAGWQSGEFQCIRKQYDTRSQFPYTDELLAQPGICGSGDHENAAVVAVGDDHDDRGARLSAG